MKNITKLIRVFFICSIMPVVAQNNNIYQDYSGTYEAQDGTVLYVAKSYFSDEMKPKDFAGYSIWYSYGGFNSWIPGDHITSLNKERKAIYNSNDVYDSKYSMCFGENDCGWYAIVLFGKTGNSYNMTIAAIPMGDALLYGLVNNNNVNDIIKNATKVLKFRRTKKSQNN